MKVAKYCPPEWDFVFTEHTSICMSLSNAFHLINGLDQKDVLFFLTAIRRTHFSRCIFFTSEIRSSEANVCIPFSLMWHSLWCDNTLVVSVSIFASFRYNRDQATIWFPLKRFMTTLSEESNSVPCSYGSLCSSVSSRFCQVFNWSTSLDSILIGSTSVWLCRASNLLESVAKVRLSISQSVAKLYHYDRRWRSQSTVHQNVTLCSQSIHRYARVWAGPSISSMVSTWKRFYFACQPYTDMCQLWCWMSCGFSHTIWKIKKIITLYYLNGLLWKDGRLQELHNTFYYAWNG